MNDFVELIVILVSLIIFFGTFSFVIFSFHEKWLSFFKYFAAIPFALSNGILLKIALTLFLILQRFFIPFEHFESNVIWFEAIILPGIYGFLFFGSISIVPRYYFEFSLVVLIVIFVLDLLAIYYRDYELWISDFISYALVTKTIPEEPSIYLAISQIVFKNAGSFYAINKFKNN